MKSIALFFPKRERRRNPALEKMVTPTQTLIASGVVFLAALWPLLALRIGRPTSWLGELVFVFCASGSVLTAPSMCLATAFDIIRRRADARVFFAFVLSLAGVGAICTFIYLRLHQYDRAAYQSVQPTAGSRFAWSVFGRERGQPPRARAAPVGPSDA